MPTQYTMPSHHKGDTFEALQFTLLETVGGAPIDLTGVTIECIFRKGNKQGLPVKSIDTTSGITITDAVNGVFNFDAFILDWDAGLYYYDIEFTFTDGTIKTYIEGTIKINQDVTYG
jgi:hypothetical protein